MDNKEQSIINRVAQSGLITIDLKDFLPVTDIRAFDLAPFLFMGLVLKEKDYRDALKNFDWSVFKGQKVAVYCSADAIIPVWAFMLAAVYLNQVNAEAHFGTVAETKKKLVLHNIENFNINEFKEQRIIIKGCADDDIDTAAYVAFTQKLMPVVKSIMYGEACSNVPLYKQKTVGTNQMSHPE